MGAKKKGGAANRLAKMSDEDRAKYFQRRADAEEEARRRKEQLVATFMKNKLRKEDAFSRINLAKINQQYHQTMRLGKCKEMKQDVEHLSQSIDRVVGLKNRTIGKLMGDLDWQEDLYIKNLQTHTEHVENLIDFHNKQTAELYDGYNDEKTMVLHVGKKERVEFENKARDDLDYLKTIIYGQDQEAKAALKKDHDFYVKQTDELITTYKTELSDMKKAENNKIYSLWKQIAKIIINYIKRNDARRSHLAELERLDTEGALAREKNEKKIAKQLDEIEKLKQDYTELVEDRQDCIRSLQNLIKEKTAQLFKMRKDLQQDIALDEKRLRELASTSQASIEELKELASKGAKIKALAEMCSKFEYAEDKIGKIAKLKPEDNFSALTQVGARSSSSSSSSKSHKELIVRPQTGIVKSKRGIPALALRKRGLALKEPILTLEQPTESNFTVELRQPSPKPLVAFESFVESSKSSEDSENSFNVLEKLEGLWGAHNKVNIDCLFLKQQRKQLRQENDKLKETVRGVLEDVALNKASPARSHPRRTTTGADLFFQPPFMQAKLYDNCFLFTSYDLKIKSVLAQNLQYHLFK